MPGQFWCLFIFVPDGAYNDYTWRGANGIYIDTQYSLNTTQPITTASIRHHPTAILWRWLGASGDWSNSVTTCAKCIAYSLTLPCVWHIAGIRKNLCLYSSPIDDKTVTSSHFPMQSGAANWSYSGSGSWWRLVTIKIRRRIAINLAPVRLIRKDRSTI